MQRRKDQLADRDQSDAHVQCNGVRAIEPGDSQIGCEKRHFEAEDCETVLWTTSILNQGVAHDILLREVFLVESETPSSF